MGVSHKSLPLSVDKNRFNLSIIHSLSDTLPQCSILCLFHCLISLPLAIDKNRFRMQILPNSSLRSYHHWYMSCFTFSNVADTFCSGLMLKESLIRMVMVLHWLVKVIQPVQPLIKKALFVLRLTVRLWLLCWTLLSVNSVLLIQEKSS